MFETTSIGMRDRSRWWRLWAPRAAGGLDLEAIEQHVRELLGWVERIGEMATKARTIQSSGKFIEDHVSELKGELDRRLNEVLQVLARAE